MMDALVADLVKLQTVGIMVDRERWHLVVLGITGDLQFFTKIGKLERSYNHISKKSGQKTHTGICHLCMGGVPGCSFEDFSDEPVWLSTVGAEEPWSQEPSFARRLRTETCNRAAFLNPKP